MSEVPQLENFTLYFECKYKFGLRKIQAPTFEDAKLKAETLTKGGAWCEGRCDTCKLRITKKP